MAILINGREYDWGDISLNVGGEEIKGFTAISYKETQAKEYLYSKGRHPHSIQRGNKSFTGKLTFTQSEVIELKKKAAGLSLLAVQVDIIIAYESEDVPGQIMLDTIHGVEFTNLEMSMTQANKSMAIPIDFMALGITSIMN